ncbi:hypothetical protein CDG81_09605 [Actinopolyspora erythraea]|uniref:Phage tail protein n=1 Tax=Actinopolyspora erythraea TaxID=414996 RepID=A0A099D7U5_9ACTN|nr:hypothetical protein [Actinopolyspora erythraea]ASU78492.1 hypothetical protein CDG81_09605 [Actinopolyspora erythraea]KGI82064.1 hypothetical protein IL38_07040 [Actinopolyspora erythraea]
MALDDNAVLLAARGDIYTAPSGTAAPTPTVIGSYTDGSGLAADWVNIGHTSREELPAFGYEGGDTETLGTWQASALRETITDPAVDYVTFNLHQFDENALSLYYGVTDYGSTAGSFDVQDSSVSTIKKALLIVMVDGDVNVAFYSPNASFRREDSIELAVDSLASLPLRATFLKMSGNPLFSWISEDIPVNDGSA